MAGGGQWSFRKTRTLESQAEIGVWVQHLRGPGISSPEKKLEIVIENPAI